MDALFEGMADVLAWLYGITGSYGFAIILLTLGVRILVTPLTIRGTRSMMAMQKFQPEIRRLQQEHKGDRQRLNEELMRFYRENKINPVGSCLPLLIQMPVFLILYRVVDGITRRGDDGTFNPQYLDTNSELYRALDGAQDMMFLGLDLSRSALDTLRDNFVSSLPYLLIIAVITATSYIQQKQVSGRTTGIDINPMQKRLMQFLPLTFAFFSFTFAAALGFYFLTSNLYQVAQQWYISRALYGMRRGKLPEGAAAVVDTTSTESTLTKPGSTKGGGSTAPAERGGSGSSGRGNGTGSNRPANGRAGSRSAGGGRRDAGGGSGGGSRSSRGGSGSAAAPSGRATSGRVTEPKRGGGRGSSPGRTSGGAPTRSYGSSGSGSSGSGSSSSSGGGAGQAGNRSRRRVPFSGSDQPTAESPSRTENPPKKRRG